MAFVGSVPALAVSGEGADENDAGEVFSSSGSQSDRLTFTRCHCGWATELAEGLPGADEEPGPVIRSGDWGGRGAALGVMKIARGASMPVVERLPELQVLVDERFAPQGCDVRMAAWGEGESWERGGTGAA